MAKGQKRSNKETKKPKQAKAKPAAESATLSGRLGAAPGGAKGRKP